MTIRNGLVRLATVAGLLIAAGCSDRKDGTIVVSAIGGEPTIVNPNLEPLDPPRAMVLSAVGQGLVRFDAAGEIEPALAQSWIVSDDGLRYTFRLQRTTWSDGTPVTAAQVVGRLQAAISRASRNPLKPALGVIDEIEAMTDQVLEITLVAPRPHFLQLLAHPAMGILMREHGTGPYQAEPQAGGAVLLTFRSDEEEEPPEDSPPPFLLRGESAPRAVARFAQREADLVIGGNAGDLPIALAASPPANALRYDPVAGLFGLVFTSLEGPFADPEFRSALSMALDREGLVAALAVPGLSPRSSIVPAGIDELPAPAVPDWAASPLPMRRELAARVVERIGGEDRVPLRVAMPEGLGYRLIFSHLRRDWAAIGVDAQLVGADEGSDLRFVDAVAPAAMAGWYLRSFMCGRSLVCSPEIDALLASARAAAIPANRQGLLAQADRMLTDLVPFVPIAAPVRWSLVAERLTGFQTNPFARHSVMEVAR